MVNGLMAFLGPAMQQARAGQGAHGGSFLPGPPREDTYERDDNSFSGMYS
jgi:hypothetical protein